jgi:predicted dehydrogenase
VGLGQIGMGYDLAVDSTDRVYSHARAFRSHDAFRLLSGVDSDGARRKTFEDSYGAPAYSDVESALTKPPVPDVVVIGVPTIAHGSVLRRVLEAASPRAVLCEKPLSYDIEEARFMVAECARRGVALYVNYMRRSDPAAIEIGERIADGRIASPMKGFAWYSKGFLHNGSHFFNLLEYWLGPMRDFDVIEIGRRWQETDPEPDVRIEFAKGTVVFVAAKEEEFSHYSIELVAANGRLRYDRGGEAVEWQPAVADANFPGYVSLSPEVEPIPSGMDRYQWHVADELASALSGGESRICTGAEALTTLESMHKIIAELC